MGRHPSMGKRQKKWIYKIIDEVGLKPEKVYQNLLDIHPKLCPSRLQVIKYVNFIIANPDEPQRFKEQQLKEQKDREQEAKKYKEYMNPQSLETIANSSTPSELQVQPTQ